MPLRQKATVSASIWPLWTGDGLGEGRWNSDKMMEFACAERNTPGVGRRVGIGEGMKKVIIYLRLGKAF